MTVTPLSLGAEFPALDLVTPAGTPADAPGGAGSFVIYFMRTPTCPVCHAHLKAMERTTTPTGRPLAELLTVVVPGDAADAAAVEKRHPRLAGRVLASETAHEAVGLFVRAGLQQSGTFVVGADGRIAHVTAATVPTGSYNQRATLAAL